MEEGTKARSHGGTKGAEEIPVKSVAGPYVTTIIVKGGEIRTQDGELCERVDVDTFFVVPTRITVKRIGTSRS